MSDDSINNLAYILDENLIKLNGKLELIAAKLELIAQGLIGDEGVYQGIMGADGLVDRVDAHSGLLEESIISLRDEVAQIKERLYGR